MAIALIKVLRLLYCYKLIKLSNELRDVISIIKQMLPKLAGIAFLLFMALVVFSVMGMSYFGKAKQGNFINYKNNFSDFWSSSLVLIKCLVGANWNRYMRELGTPHQNCVSSQSYAELFVNGPQVCGGYKSWFFFIFFIMICRMLILNLVVAVFVEYFITKKIKTKFINKKNVSNFYYYWSLYDTGLEYDISCKDFILLCLQLKQPFDSLFDYIDKKRPEIKGNLTISPDNKIVIEDLILIRIAYFLNGVTVKPNGRITLYCALEYLLFKIVVGNIEDFEFYKPDDHINTEFLSLIKKKYEKTIGTKQKSKRKSSKMTNLLKSSKNSKKSSKVRVQAKASNFELLLSKEKKGLMEFIAEEIILNNLKLLLKEKKGIKGIIQSIVLYKQKNRNFYNFK